jgi:hypothetical protein
MKCFGPLAAQTALEFEEAPTPHGEPCAWCGTEISFGDCGFLVPLIGQPGRTLAEHRECFLRQIVGSVAHQRAACSCFGGRPQPSATTTTPRERRLEALAAVAHWMQHRKELPPRPVPASIIPIPAP